MRFAVTFLFAMLFGCATAVIKVEGDLSKGEFGPAPVRYEERIREYWNSSLKDPSSLQVKSIGSPEKSFVYTALTKDHWYDNYVDVEYTPVYGYRVCATLNAKNSYGGYTGWKTDTFFFDNTGKMQIPRYKPKSMMGGMPSKGSVISGETTAPTTCSEGE